MRLSEMRTEVTPQKINKIMERSFGFTIDYDNLSYAKAQRLNKALTENIHAIKKSFGAHTAEKNAKYMELMMVKEGLDRWLNSEQGLFESEIGASEARLAAQDIVDSIQDMIEKLGKIQNEQVPALVATIRDQIGMEQSEQFKHAIKPVLDTLYQAATSGQEQAETAVLQLAGEQPVGGDMNMGGGADLGGGDLGGDELGGAPEGGDDLGDLGGEAPPESDMDTDGFGAVDAAAGGAEALGRERRGMSESRGMTEGAGQIGRAVKKIYSKLYRLGDDAVDHVYHNAPTFRRVWNKFEGDINSIVQEVPDQVLQKIYNELVVLAKEEGIAEDGAGARRDPYLDYREKQVQRRMSKGEPEGSARRFDATGGPGKTMYQPKPRPQVKKLDNPLPESKRSRK